MHLRTYHVGELSSPPHTFKPTQRGSRGDHADQTGLTRSSLFASSIAQVNPRKITFVGGHSPFSTFRCFVKNHQGLMLGHGRPLQHLSMSTCTMRGSSVRRTACRAVSCTGQDQRHCQDADPSFDDMAPHDCRLRPVTHPRRDHTCQWMIVLTCTTAPLH